MKTHYTLNFLVKYLYGETPTLKKLEIENAIEEDSFIRNEYLALKEGFNKLPKVQFYPKDSTINSILNYSNSIAINPSLN